MSTFKLNIHVQASLIPGRTYPTTYALYYGFVLSTALAPAASAIDGAGCVQTEIAPDPFRLSLPPAIPLPPDGNVPDDVIPPLVADYLDGEPEFAGFDVRKCKGTDFADLTTLVAPTQGGVMGKRMVALSEPTSTLDSHPEDSMTEAFTVETFTAEVSMAESSMNKTFVNETSMAETFTAETSMAETSVAEMSTAETSMAETSMNETSMNKTSITETSIVETSTAEISMAGTSINETSMNKISKNETSMTETSTAETSTVEISTTDVSVAETPTAETFTAEASMGDIFMTDVSATDSIHTPLGVDKYSFTATNATNSVKSTGSETAVKTTSSQEQSASGSIAATLTTSTSSDGFPEFMFFTTIIGNTTIKGAVGGIATTLADDIVVDPPGQTLAEIRPIEDVIALTSKTILTDETVEAIVVTETDTKVLDRLSTLIISAENQLKTESQNVMNVGQRSSTITRQTRTRTASPPAQTQEIVRPTSDNRENLLPDMPTRFMPGSESNDGNDDEDEDEEDEEDGPPPENFIGGGDEVPEDATPAASITVPPQTISIGTGLAEITLAPNTDGSNGVLVINQNIVQPGQQTTINRVPVSLIPDLPVVIIDKTDTVPLADFVDPDFALGTEAQASLAPPEDGDPGDPGKLVFRGSETLSPGEETKLPGGAALILTTVKALLIDTSTVPVSDNPPSRPSQTVNVGSSPMVVEARSTDGPVVLQAPQTVRRGGVATINGAPVSVPRSGSAIVVDGTSTVQIRPLARQPEASAPALAPSRPGAVPVVPAVLQVGDGSFAATVVDGTTEFVVGPGATLTPGGMVTVDGNVVSLPADAAVSRVVINGATSTLATPTPAPALPVLNVGGDSFTATILDGTAEFVVGPRATLTPGGVVTVDGNVVSLPADAAVSRVVVNGATSTLASLTPAPALPVLNVGGDSFTATIADGTTEFVVGPGQTLVPGGTRTVDGTVVNLPSDSAVSRVVIDGVTSTFAAPAITPAPARINVGGDTFTADVVDGTTQFVVGPGNTLRPGAVVTIDGTVVSLPSGPTPSVVVVDGVTSTFITPAITSAPPVIDVGGDTFTADVVDGTTQFVVGTGNTLRPGAVVTIDGTVVSLPSGPTPSVVVVDGVTSTLTIPSLISPAPPLIIDGEAFPAVTVGTEVGFVIDVGQTLLPGDIAIIDGKTISLPADSPTNSIVIIDGATSTIGDSTPFDSTVTPAPLTLNNQIFPATVIGSSTFFSLAPGITLTPGGVAVVDGTTVSLPDNSPLSNSIVIIDGETSTFPSAPSITAPPVITINGELFTGTVVDGTSTLFEIAPGTTLTPGGVVVVDGTRVSLVSEGMILVFDETFFSAIPSETLDVNGGGDGRREATVIDGPLQTDADGNVVFDGAASTLAAFDGATFGVLVVAAVLGGAAVLL